MRLFPGVVADRSHGKTLEILDDCANVFHISLILNLYFFSSNHQYEKYVLETSTVSIKIHSRVCNELLYILRLSIVSTDVHV